MDLVNESNGIMKMASSCGGTPAGVSIITASYPRGIILDHTRGFN